MSIAVVDVDAKIITRPGRTQPAEQPRIVTHEPGCYVDQHSHGWQRTCRPRCSARFWCATHRVWFNGGRCFPDPYRYG